MHACFARTYRTNDRDRGEPEFLRPIGKGDFGIASFPAAARRIEVDFSPIEMALDHLDRFDLPPEQRRSGRLQPLLDGLQDLKLVGPEKISTPFAPPHTAILEAPIGDSQGFPVGGPGAASFLSVLRVDGGPEASGPRRHRYWNQIGCLMRSANWARSINRSSNGSPSTSKNDS